MLTRETMGVLALAILWVNTLLVAAAALKQAGEHTSRLRALRSISPGDEGEGLLHGRIEEGLGPGGALACHEVEQIGRAASEQGGQRAILFGDRSFRGAVL